MYYTVTLVNRALVASEPNNLTIALFAAHPVLDVGPTCHKPTKAPFASEIKRRRRRVQFASDLSYIADHIPTNAGCRTLFLKEHSSQSIPEHGNPVNLVSTPTISLLLH
jgi:hypothetical protein